MAHVWLILPLKLLWFSIKMWKFTRGYPLGTTSTTVVFFSGFVTWIFRTLPHGLRIYHEHFDEFWRCTKWVENLPSNGRFLGSGMSFNTWAIAKRSILNDLWDLHFRTPPNWSLFMTTVLEGFGWYTNNSQGECNRIYEAFCRRSGSLPSIFVWIERKLTLNLSSRWTLVNCTSTHG